MAMKPPVFPIPDPHHFSDYGFDPQFDYFQVLEEAKRYKQSSTKSSSTDTFFQLNLHDTNKNRRRWWKTALFFFFKSRLSRCGAHPSSTVKPVVLRPASLSGPIYITESLSGSSTPFRRTTSGPLQTPYFSLRDLNSMDLRISPPSPLPIYLVT